MSLWKSTYLLAASKIMTRADVASLHNGGNDPFSARLGILTILTIGFFVYGNQNYDV
jgi:hypothetical protein